MSGTRIFPVEQLTKLSKNIEKTVLPLEEEHYYHKINVEFREKIDVLNKKTTHILSDLGRKLLPEASGLEDGEHVSEYCARLLDGISHRMETNYSDRVVMKKTSEKETTIVAEKGTGNGVRAAVQRTKAPSGFISYMRSTLNEKPQQSFEDAVDNSNKPFVHYFGNLKGVDVGYLNERRDSALAAGLPCPHPLKELLDDLDKHYLETQLQKPDILTKPKDFSETKFSYIDSVSELGSVVERLNQVQELAVDLEAHSHRSFLGFCCLMQLSTREEDIVIDVIKLRSHIGRLLGPIFANPKVVKVLHGSRSDIVWLQRDFGIYVCNLFDTGIATRVLNYSANGLGYLLGKLCGFDADKRFQLADWRIRPLSEEAIHYARADTHYLLYCYDVLRGELATLSEDQIPDQFSLGEYRPESGIFAVLEASKKLCYSMFEKELFHDFSFMDFYSKSENKFGVLNDQQLAVFAALYEWRDEIARERDESPGFVMSRANMVEVAKAVPQSHKALKAILKKKSSIGMAESRALLERIMKFLEDDSIVSKARAIVKQADDDGRNELPEKRKLPLDLYRIEEEQGNESHRSQFVPKQLEKNVTIISSKNAHGMMMRKASENVSKRRAVAKAIKGSSSIPIEMVSLPSGQDQSNKEPQPDSSDLHEKDSPKQEILPTHDTVKTTEVKPNLDGHGVDDKMMSEDMISVLPLTLSEQKSVPGKSRRRRSYTRLKQKPTRNESILESTTSGKDLQNSDKIFDPSEAVAKYNSTKKQPNVSNHRRRNPKQEMQQLIPSGMFNPYGDLQSIGSKSRRSTTQIRSGNRTSNFK